jgi:hypothetical protein
MNTYAELKTAIYNWTHRPEAEMSPFIPDILMAAEKLIMRRVRAPEMEASLTVALSGGVAAVPTDFAELKHCRIDGSPVRQLTVRPAVWIYSEYPNRSAGGVQCFIARDALNFIFGPGGANGTLVGTYYKHMPTIYAVAPDDQTVSTNALFLANPDLYLWACMAETMPFLVNDKRVPLWISKRDGIIDDINREGRKSVGGDAMAVMVG